MLPEPEDRPYDVEAILASFSGATPRKVCISSNPWGAFGELGGCGGAILGVILLMALISGGSQVILIVAAVVAAVLVVLALLMLPDTLEKTVLHSRLAKYGIAVVAEILSMDSVCVDDGTPAPSSRVTVKYKFRTQDGREVINKKSTMSGVYKILVQENDGAADDLSILIVYLPNKPQANEPYDSLQYRICD